MRIATIIGVLSKTSEKNLTQISMKRDSYSSVELGL
jgi:hypothetical protein